MKHFSLFITIIFLVFNACSGNKSQDTASSDTAEQSFDYTKIDYTPLDSTSNKLTLLVSHDFANSIIVGDNTIKGLQRAHNNIFEGEELIYADGNATCVVYQLNYKNSYLKIFYNDFEGAISDTYFDLSSNDLVSAVINDEVIQMQNGIHLGMSKEDFFNELLGRKLTPKIDTVQMNDELGDIQLQFIFANEKLEKMLATSSYVFADFNFDHQ